MSKKEAEKKLKDIYKDIDSGKIKKEIASDSETNLKEQTLVFFKWFWISFGMIIGVVLFIWFAGWVYAWLRS